MLITSKNLQAAQKGYRTIFMEAYHGNTETIWTELGMRTESMSAEETYHWLGAIPGLRELIGEVQIKNLIDHDLTIVNKEWEDTIGVPRKDFERDRLGIYNPLMQAMGMAARSHPDELIAEVVSTGFSTKCYTGKNFFDTNHEPKKGGTKFSNKGTKKLSAANFETARNSLRSRKNSEGRSMKLGRDLVLLVSPANESLAREITVAEKVKGGDTNVNKGTARPVVMPELSTYSDDAWFLLEVGQPIKPFIVQIEKEAELVSVTNADDSHVVLKKEFIYQAYARHNVAGALPELTWGSTGADPA